MVKKTLISIAIIALTLAALAFALRMALSPAKFSESRLSIGSAFLVVEIADARQPQAQGLSGRDSLAPDRGMLFTYSDKQIRNFWMKDMRFPLDVLWIADSKVVGMQENIPLQSDGGGVRRFASNAPADTVLEVNAGWVREHGISIGDLAKLDTSAR